MPARLRLVLENACPAGAFEAPTGRSGDDLLSILIGMDTDFEGCRAAMLQQATYNGPACLR
ncbi:hypothetical protein ASG25_02160 [Rhizobium sp. Leaf384]|nr:hypothetical protein ASG25_02160 [Rhizobium sp. Leaf384]KQS86486.1 hypothetical protein ASG58_17225 [Rhizobium sp. Leaf383]